MEVTCHPRELLSKSPVAFCSEQPAEAGLGGALEEGGGHRNTLTTLISLKSRRFETKTGIFWKTKHKIHILNRLSSSTLHKIINA